MKYKVDGIDACKPINELLNHFINNEYKIINQSVTDYHFNELLFELTPTDSKIDFNTININGIKKHDDKTFVCDCHWSRIVIG